MDPGYQIGFALSIVANHPPCLSIAHESIESFQSMTLPMLDLIAVFVAARFVLEEHLDVLA
jgi:hypothetical protein